MASFSVSEIASIQEAARAVIDVTLYNAAQADALDNPEYLAAEIIALSEWSSVSIEHNRAVAGCVLSGHDWPSGVALAVRADFGMPY